MGQEELDILAEIIELFGRLHPIGNKTARDVSLEPINRRLNSLRQRVALDRADLCEYIEQLRDGYSGMLATRPTGGNSPQQHQVWANNAIRVLERELGKFEYLD